MPIIPEEDRTEVTRNCLTAASQLIDVASGNVTNDWSFAKARILDAMRELISAIQTSEGRDFADMEAYDAMLSVFARQDKG